MGQLAGGIAHDFDDLLNAVLSLLALLRKRLPADEQQAARLVDDAIQGAERGAALTQRLLAFGRRQALMPEVVDLPALVRGMSALLRPYVGAGVRVAVRLPEVLPPVEVDASQVELALLNLAENARDAMPGRRGHRPSQHMRLRCAGARRTGFRRAITWCSASTPTPGLGWTEAALTQAVEPFFTTKGVGKGTGLGLSMVHGFAAQSGGRFRLHSR